MRASAREEAAVLVDIESPSVVTVVTVERLLPAAVTVLSRCEHVVEISERQQSEIKTRFAVPEIIEQGGGGYLAGGGGFWGMGIQGGGEIVGLADSGVDAGSCWFRAFPGEALRLCDGFGAIADCENSEHPKILSYRFLWSNSTTAGEEMDQVDGHGTHLAGALTGRAMVNGSDLTAFSPYNGVAPMAKLVVDDLAPASTLSLTPPADLASSLFPHAYRYGARIYCNGWGPIDDVLRPLDNDVGAYGRQSDAFVAAYPDMLLLFPAGNAGRSHAVGDPATAKNVLTVGATYNTRSAFGTYGADASGLPSDTAHTLARYSSQGPTADFRFKPEVLCTGGPVSAAASDGAPDTYSSCQTTTREGTSVATALCSGAAVLVRQWLRAGGMPGGSGGPGTGGGPAGGVNVSAALLKAMLVHAADKVSVWDAAAREFRVPAKFPNHQAGFGKVNLGSVVPGLGEGSNNSGVDGNFSLFFRGEEALVEGDVKLYCFRIPEGGCERFRVTVVWTDRASSMHSERVLMNDLDLLVVGPDSGGGQFYYGNGLESWDETHGTQAVRDSLNNVERVSVENAGAGLWQVQVMGADIPYGEQRFAIVVTGAREHTDPTGECGRVAQCPNRCSGNGLCDRGQCRCRVGHSGVGCALEDRELKLGDNTVVVGGFSPVNYRFTIPEEGMGWTIWVQPTDGSNAAARVFTPGRERRGTIVLVGSNRAPSFAGYENIGEDLGYQLVNGFQYGYSTEWRFQLASAYAPAGVWVVTLVPPNLNVSYNLRLETSPGAQCFSSYQGPLSPGDPACSAITRDANASLSLLFKSTNGPSWLRSDNWHVTSDVCTWYGVRCTGTRVVAIELSDNNLQGVLPGEIFENLPDLEVLKMAGNQIGGRVPWSITLLELVHTLDLSRNRLISNLPDISTCRLLNSLDLSFNRLSGPFDLRTLPAALRHLHLHHNAFSRSLDDPPLPDFATPTYPIVGLKPSSLTLPPSLSLLDLSYNHFTGPIPVALLSPLAAPSLLLLDLRHNHFSGLIPQPPDPLPTLIPTTSPPPLLLNTSNYTAANVSYAPPLQVPPLQLRRLLLGGNPLNGSLPVHLAGLWNVSVLAETDLRGGGGSRGGGCSWTCPVP